MTTVIEAIRKLRKETNARIQDCKEAWSKSGGNYEKAVQIIKERNKHLASKRSDRTAEEGLVVTRVAPDAQSAVLLAMGTETDFVARERSFIALAESIAAEALLQKVTNLEALKQMKMGEESVQEHVNLLSGTVGEKLTLAAYSYLEGPCVATYIHTGNRLGTGIVIDRPNHPEVAKELTLQVVAYPPKVIHKEALDSQLIDAEKDLIKRQMEASGRSYPEDKIPFIIENKLKQRQKEWVLMDQVFWKGSNQSVSDYVQSVAPGLKVKQMARLQVGN